MPTYGPREVQSEPILLNATQKAVLLSILALGPGATTSAIKTEIRRRVGPVLNLGGLVSMIRGLSLRDYLIVDKADRPDDQLGGQTPNVHFVTEAGLKILRQTIAFDEAIHAGLDLDSVEVLEEAE